MPYGVDLAEEDMNRKAAAAAAAAHMLDLLAAYLADNIPPLNNEHVNRNRISYTCGAPSKSSEQRCARWRAG